MCTSTTRSPSSDQRLYSARRSITALRPCRVLVRSHTASLPAWTAASPASSLSWSEMMRLPVSASSSRVTPTMPPWKAKRKATPLPACTFTACCPVPRALALFPHGQMRTLRGSQPQAHPLARHAHPLPGHPPRQGARGPLPSDRSCTRPGTLLRAQASPLRAHPRPADQSELRVCAGCRRCHAHMPPEIRPLAHPDRQHAHSPHLHLPVPGHSELPAPFRLNKQAGVWLRRCHLLVHPPGMKGLIRSIGIIGSNGMKEPVSPNGACHPSSGATPCGCASTVVQQADSATPHALQLSRLRCKLCYSNPPTLEYLQSTPGIHLSD